MRCTEACSRSILELIERINLGEVQRPHLPTVPEIHIQEPLALEFVECLTHGRPARPGSVGDFGLCKSVTGQKPKFKKFCLELPIDGIGQILWA